MTQRGRDSRPSGGVLDEPTKTVLRRQRSGASRGNPRRAADEAEDSLPDTGETAQTDPAQKRALPSRRAPRARGPGDTIGRYRIEGSLGGGGMGVVYRAYDRELERDIALKLLRPASFGPDDSAAPQRARLVREAQAMAKLAHPNVAAVHDVGTVDGDVFVAMELVEGDNLRNWLRARPRAWPAIVDVFSQAAAGLTAAHEAGIVHRDFKPANVLVGSDGRVRVVDFGLARAGAAASDFVQADEDPTGGPLRQDAITQVGDIVGTPAYMAPEQHAGAEPDPRSDQFGFCVSLWEAVYGKRPYSGQTAAAIYIATTRGPPVPPARRSVPSALRRLVVRGLAADPEERFASMEALAAELRALRRRRVWVAGAAAAVAIAAVSGGGMITLARQTGMFEASPENVCADAGAPMREVWSDARSDALAAAFAESGHPQAQANAERLGKLLDLRAAEWATTRQAACEASRVEGYQSDAELQQRMDCLDRRRRELAALLALWVHADRSAVDEALDAVYGLRSPGQCTIDRRPSDAAAPIQPERAATLAKLQAMADETQALLVAARYDDARERSEPLLARARDLAWPRFTAEALHLHASVLDAVGDHERAATLHGESARAAAKAGDSTAAAQALGALLFYHASLRGDPEAAMVLAPAAEAMAELSGDPLERGRVANALGAVLINQGRFDRAAATFEQAVALRVEAHGELHPSVASALGNVATAHRLAKRMDEALVASERAAGIVAAIFPAVHPAQAKVHAARAALASANGDEAGAVEHETRALEIRRAVFGDAHRMVAHSLNNLAAYSLAAKRPAASAQWAERAVEVLQEVVEPEHLELGQALSVLGDAKLAAGEYEAAATAATRGVEILDRYPGRVLLRANAHLTLALGLDGSAGEPKTIHQHASQAAGLYAEAGGSPYEAQARALAERTAPQ
ncbi:MAG: serine/threonine-protein kinase [Myxococcota bacterium]